MRRRCREPWNLRYGGRGISVCEEWESSYLSFLTHVGRRPSKTHSIDRIDNERGYAPGNVRWATKKEQSRNTRSNRKLTAFSKTMTIAEWAEETGLDRLVIHNRLNAGWPTQDVLSRPVRLELKNGTRAIRLKASDRKAFLHDRRGVLSEIARKLGVGPGHVTRVSLGVDSSDRVASAWNAAVELWRASREATQ